MEKLIELLNEYDGEDLEYGFIDGEIRRKVKNFDDERNTWKQVVWYTKHFGFIKWLLENDKIDLDKIDRKVRIYSYVDEYEEYDYVYPDNHRQLLMLLAIQDKPIEFLVSVLK